MQLPHWPTAIWVLVGVIALIAVYHFAFNRR